MTEVKPATNAEIAAIKADIAEEGTCACNIGQMSDCAPHTCAEVLSLIERIEYEVAYKDEYEAAQRDALAEKDAKLADQEHQTLAALDEVARLRVQETDLRAALAWKARAEALEAERDSLRRQLAQSVKAR